MTTMTMARSTTSKACFGEGVGPFPPSSSSHIVGGVGGGGGRSGVDGETKNDRGRHNGGPEGVMAEHDESDEDEQDEGEGESYPYHPSPSIPASKLLLLPLLPQIASNDVRYRR